MRLIDADALKKTLCEEYEAREHYIGEKMLEAIDNAPTVVTYSEEDMCNATSDGYDVGYEFGIRTQRRPQGELIELTDEVWKLYKKHQSHLATYVLEFGKELADLLGKYNEGGAEE